MFDGFSPFAKQGITNNQAFRTGNNRRVSLAFYTSHPIRS